MKKIAIAIPTYNRNDLLVKLIKTIPEDIQVFVSDNGCFVTDEVKSQFSNLNMVAHKNVISIFENWNSALSSVSDCDYVAIPSDDDLYIKDKFDFISDTIQNSDADILVFGNNFIDGDDNIIGQYSPLSFELFERSEGLNAFLYGVDVRMPSVFFKKSFLDKIGYFDESLFTLTAADSELVQRALLLGTSVFVPEVVSSYRVWSGSLTDQKIASNHWMNEVEAWTKKIRSLATNQLSGKANMYNWGKYQDEIFARNLLGGISNLYRSKKYKEVIAHFRSMRYPKHALLKTKLRIFKYLTLSFMKQYHAS